MADLLLEGNIPLLTINNKYSGTIEEGESLIYAIDLESADVFDYEDFREADLNLVGIRVFDANSAGFLTDSVELYDSTGTRVEREFNTITDYRPAPGRYYIKITGSSEFQEGVTGEFNITAFTVRGYRDLVFNEGYDIVTYPEVTEVVAEYANSKYYDGIGVIEANKKYTGTFDRGNDVDTFAIELVAGETYRVQTSGGALLGVRNSQDIPENRDDVFVASETGTYYVEVLPPLTRDGVFDGGNYGFSIFVDSDYETLVDNYETYPVSVVQSTVDSPFTRVADDFSNTIEGATDILAGSDTIGTIENRGDTDTFRIELRGGTSYEIKSVGNYGRGIEDVVGDSYLRILDAEGNILAQDDDVGNGISDLDPYDALINFVPPEDGVYYIQVEAFNSLEVGEYVLSVDGEPFDFTPDLEAPEFKQGFSEFNILGRLNESTRGTKSLSVFVTDNETLPEDLTIDKVLYNGVLIELNPSTTPRTFIDANGARIAISIDGTITWDAPAIEEPTVERLVDQIGIFVSDEAGNQSQFTLPIRVINTDYDPNIAPVANDDVIGNISRTATVQFNLLDNDTDANGDQLEITEVNNLPFDLLEPSTSETYRAEDGWLADNPDSTIFYKADGSVAVERSPSDVLYTDELFINYTISDGAKESSAQARITYEPLPENILPTANPDVIERREGEVVITNILANDSDPDVILGINEGNGIEGDVVLFDINGVPLFANPPVSDEGFLSEYGFGWYQLSDSVYVNEDGRVAAFGGGEDFEFTYNVRDERFGVSEQTTVSVVSPEPEPEPVDPEPVEPVEPVDPITGDIADSLIRVRNYKGGGTDKLQWKGINAMGDYTFVLNESLDNKGDDILTGQNYKIGLGAKGAEDGFLFSETFGLEDGQRAVIAFEGDEVFEFIGDTGADRFKAHVINADTNEVLMSAGVGDFTKETSDPFENKLFNWGFDQPVYAVDQTFI